VTVTPAAIPFPSALTANLYGDTITITPTGISGGTATTVALEETAEGAVVTATPSPVPSFGNQQEGATTAAATLTITNTGTMPVTITPSLGGPDPTAFALSAPGATSLAANGGSYSLGPKFAPVTGGPLSAQVSLAQGSGDVLCQPLPGAIALSGTGTNGALTLGAGSVSFPAQTCGATAGQTTTVKLTNNGTASLTFNAAVLGTSGFQVAPSTGSLAAGGGTTLLTVTSPTFGTATGNVNAVTDTLRVSTSAYGDTSHDIALSSTPSGAILAWGTGPFAFGTVQATSNASKSASLPFSLDNKGNVAATVSFATQGTAPYTFSPQNTSLGNGALDGTATFTPTTSGAHDDAMLVQVAAGTPLCAPLPAGLALNGTGAQGAFSSDLSSLGFALTCNAAPVSQSFTIVNGDTEPYDFTTSIGAGWTVSPASGTVPLNGTTLITVTAPAEGDVKPGTGNDVKVTITTDIPGDTAHAYPVSGTASGAELEFASATLEFGNENVVMTDTTTLTNDGNAAATVSALVVAATANPDYPSTAALQINSQPSASWSGTLDVGANTITYTYTGTGQQVCDTVYSYTVTLPKTTTAGVCSSTTQTLTIVDGSGC
jgi:hypothetical protein